MKICSKPFYRHIDVYGNVVKVMYQKIYISWNRVKMQVCKLEVLSKKMGHENTQINVVSLDMLEKWISDKYLESNAFDKLSVYCEPVFIKIYSNILKVMYQKIILGIEKERARMTLNALHLGWYLRVEKFSNLTISLQDHKSYLKNSWTNTGLVCTSLNVFFILNPNMATKIWIFGKFYRKSLKILICRLH